MDKTNVMAEFIIIGEEFEPNILTTELSIEPTKFWRKGDDIEGRNIKRKNTCWIISTGYEESLDINKQVEKIVELIKDKRNTLKELKIEYNIDYMFEIVVRIENNEKPAMYFNSDFIAFINDIKAEIDIDLYIY